jgi:hypothetical protein
MILSLPTASAPATSTVRKFRVYSANRPGFEKQVFAQNENTAREEGRRASAILRRAPFLRVRAA